jgi:hypothetical protein
MGHANFGANCIIADGTLAVASFPGDLPRYIPEILFYDVSNPEQPVRRGGFIPPGEPEWFALGANIVYVACLGGLLVADASVPEEPRFLGSIGIPYDGEYWQLAKVDLNGDYVFIVHGKTLSVMPAQCGETSGSGGPIVSPAVGLAVSVSPNPAAGDIGILVESPSDELLEVEVFDMAGRVVRRLFGGKATLGTIRFEWDGKNDSGDRVANGAYMVRVSGSGRSATSKAILLRR